MKIVTVVGNPRPKSRTRSAAEMVAQTVGRMFPDTAHSYETLDLGSADKECATCQSSLPVEDDLDLVRGANIIVVASPTYKGTYTGLLKSFFDRFSAGDLREVVAIPLMVGGAPAHALSVEVHLRPLLVELDAVVPTRGIYIVEGELALLDDTVAVWGRGAARSLRKLLTD